MAITRIRLLFLAAVVLDVNVRSQGLPDWAAYQVRLETLQASKFQPEFHSDDRSFGGKRFLARTQRIDQTHDNRNRLRRLDDPKGRPKGPKGDMLPIGMTPPKGGKGNGKSKFKGKGSKSKSKKNPAALTRSPSSVSPQPSQHGSPYTGAPATTFPPMATTPPTRTRFPSISTPFPSIPNAKSFVPSAPQILLSNIPSMIPTICVGQDCNRPPRPI